MTVRAVFNYIRAQMEEQNRANQRGIFTIHDVDFWEDELLKKEKNAERKGIAKAVSNSKGTGGKPSTQAKQ